MFDAVPRTNRPASSSNGRTLGSKSGRRSTHKKARSEFIIAPILMEFRRIMAAGFDSFSGVKFNVDASRGLDGYCIFLLTRSRLQSVLTTPVVTIVEAKNDNVRCELGQCIASIVAAREFNSRFVPPAAAVQDVVTAGSAWKFLRLGSAEWKLDIEEYCVSQLGRIIGIPAHILKAACC